MAAQAGGQKCKHCECSTGHSRPCPIEIGTPEAMAEWRDGYDYGLEDNFLQPWTQSFNARQRPTWHLGYVIGKAEIDELVDLAIERNNSYEYGEEG